MNGCRVSFAIAATLLMLLPLPVRAATPLTLVAKVERVSDGDTLMAFTSEGAKLRIRLLDMDAPEVPYGDKAGQPFGEEARDGILILDCEDLGRGYEEDWIEFEIQAPSADAPGLTRLNAHSQTSQEAKERSPCRMSFFGILW